MRIETETEDDQAVLDFYLKACEINKEDKDVVLKIIMNNYTRRTATEFERYNQYPLFSPEDKIICKNSTDSELSSMASDRINYRPIRFKHYRHRE